MPDTRIIISGGGTGGHIFPAIAIADAIKRRNPAAEILFIGARGKMEMEKVPSAGYRIIGLWISGYQRNYSWSNLLLPFKIIFSLIQAAIIILKFKPHAVVGVGGFASGPTMRMASLLGVPTAIQEQNSFPGKTNKLLAKKAGVVCVAYDNMERYFKNAKIVKTGNPIRSDFNRTGDISDESFRYFNLDKTKKVILVVGGSQGAVSINNAISIGLKNLIDSGFQIIWQTGRNGFQKAGEAIRSQGFDTENGMIRVYDFINRMDYAYTCASLIVSRAGAIAIAELCTVGKPLVLIPFPHAAEDHQTQNALALVEKQAAILIRNQDASQMLIKTILHMMDNYHDSLKMAENLKKLALHNSSDLIVDEIFNLIKVS